MSEPSDPTEAAEPPESSRSSNATRRVIRVLQALVGWAEGRTLSDLAAELDIPVATCSSVLASLVEERVVDRTPDKRYQLRQGALDVAGLAAGSQRVLRAAATEVPELVRATGLPVTLTRISLEGLEVLRYWAPGQPPVHTGVFALPFSAPYGLCAVAWMSRAKATAWMAEGGLDEDERVELRRCMASLRRDGYLAWRTAEAPPDLDWVVTSLALRGDEYAADAAPPETAESETAEPEIAEPGAAEPAAAEPAPAAPRAAAVPLPASRETVEALGFVGIAGPEVKSRQRMALSHLAAPVFGPSGVPTHELELLVFAEDTTQARRLHLASLLVAAARSLSVASGGSLPE